MLVSYLGAGSFYMAADISKAGWPKHLSTLYRTFTLAIGAATWIPVCLLAARNRARRLGWRAGAFYFVGDAIPAIALFLAGLIYAAVVV
ncbi:hypothetical protein JNW90_35130 [Micromonospora sp. STR1s_5]|nr:hypothetical protein [Micromonospora sp. STR1s_5]